MQALALLLGASRPWTYWFAPVLLTAALLMVLVLAVGYVRRVLSPMIQARDAEARARFAEARRRASEQRPSRDIGSAKTA